MRRPKLQRLPSIEGVDMHGQGLVGLRWINSVDFMTAIVTMPFIAITHAKYLQGYVQLNCRLNKSLDLKNR